MEYIAGDFIWLSDESVSIFFPRTQHYFDRRVRKHQILLARAVAHNVLLAGEVTNITESNVNIISTKW